MKHCLSEIERQESELVKAEQFPENAATEPLLLRAQIISTYNSAMETEERVETLAYEEGLLREERKLLKRDYSKFPTSEVKSKHIYINFIREISYCIFNELFSSSSVGSSGRRYRYFRSEFNLLKTA